jgi:hypothetical protein
VHYGGVIREGVNVVDESAKCRRCGGSVQAGRCGVCGLDASSAGPDVAPGLTIARSLTGHLIGGVLLESIIGTGARGAVFRGRAARADGLDGRLAVKVILHDRSRARLQDVLLESARRLIDLRHESLATLRAVGSDAGLGAAYLVYEFAEGKDLREWLDPTHAPSVERAASVGAAVAEALAAVHDKGALHRDVRPAHVLVGEDDNEVVLVEAGFAPVEQFQSGHGETAHAPIVGRPEYAAPEQAREPESPGPASDVYALGGTLYHLLAGRPPFVAISPVGLLVQHASRPAPPLKSLAPSLPEGLARLIDKMLAKRPEDRPTARGAAELLHAFAQGKALDGSGKTARESASVAGAPYSRTWLRNDAALASALVGRDVARREEIDEALEARAARPGGHVRSLAEVILERGIASRHAIAQAERSVASADKRRVDATFAKLGMEQGHVHRSDLERALCETGETWVSVAQSLMTREIISAKTAAAIEVSVSQHLRERDTHTLEQFALEEGLSAAQLGEARRALTALDPDDDRSLIDLLLETGSLTAERALAIAARYVRGSLKS